MGAKRTLVLKSRGPQGCSGEGASLRPRHLIEQVSLFSNFHNRNKDPSKVMGIPVQDGTGKGGVYKKFMNQGTSQVSVTDLSSNKAKIAEYKDRMLMEKQPFGHMARGNSASVKAGAFVPYGRAVGESFIGQTADAQTFKAKDQRVQVTLSHGPQPQSTSESRSKLQPQGVFQPKLRYENSDEMIVNLKSSHVSLGQDKSGFKANRHTSPSAKERVDSQLGERTAMYSYGQQRGFASNILPLKANQEQLKPTNANASPDKKSTHQSTFVWNTFKVQ
mgnify:CR=1 FL=1